MKAKAVNIILSSEEMDAIDRAARKNKTSFEQTLAEAIEHGLDAIKTRPTTKAEATKAYIETHGDFDHGKPDRMLRVAEPHEQRFVEMGPLYAVTYEADKEGKVELWEHKFSRPKPILAFSPRSGLLVIAGGKYTVTKRGIEG
jgi:hypothetical protein